MRSLILTLPILIASCTSLPTEQATTAAICQASHQDRIDHARALLKDGGVRSKRTGAALLSGLQGACDG